jgi:hypothetical protein
MNVPNFSHRLTPSQIERVEALTGQTVERVIEATGISR